jgi:two-component system OmpR family sensor kinase/two-component system sensor histidine kinase BaeS
MNRLWVQLSLAFGTVIIVAVLTAALLANFQVSADFRQYVMRNQMMESTLLPTLTAYYADYGSWQGVETVLAGLTGPGMMGQGRGQGNGRGQRQGAPGFIVTDSGGQIIFSSTGRTGQLSDQEQRSTVPVQWQGQTIGYVVTTTPPNQAGLTAAAETFLQQINRSLITAGLIAGILGMALGVLIARNLSAPMGRLAGAARRIAQGHLNERVPVKGAEEITNLATAFNEMAEHLEQAEQLRRNLVADVAHELRTPLSVVQGNLRAILDDVYPLEKEEIASIYDETLVLNRLISDLRDLAQAEAGQLSLNLEQIDLHQLIAGVTDRFKELARQKDVRLVTQIPTRLPPVEADEDRLRQVLHNYLSNAIRHTPEGSQITISGRAVAGQVRVSVNDTGPGISADELPYVFNRFWRADGSRSRDQGGSGLGLAIAQQLIKAHHGEVGVESEPGQGSRFWFSLPQAQTASGPV